ncbi:MAG: hypothetical protein ACYC56_05410 [Candidatus Aquicultor sp.]
MKENYDVLEIIIPLLDFPARFKEIEDYLCANSNLPGPRGNLTLAFKFADYFEKESIGKDVLGLLITWVDISPDEAPTNNPREYLTFCGILALGAHYCYADETTKSLIMDRLKRAMSDTRWRTREGAAMGFQRIAEKDFNSIKNYFSMWYKGSNNFEKRALIAALAHPPILKDKEIARFSLKISEDILNDILSSDKASRRSEDFTVLSKGLQYALSVFVAHLPEEGFAFLKKWAQAPDPDIKKIIKANLGKSRLTRKYGDQVNEVLAVLGGLT